MKRLFDWLKISCGVLIILSSGLASGVAADNKPIMLSIDNPQFRRLVMAIPEFKVSDELAGNQQALQFKRTAEAELRRLINYSGLFNIIDEAGYSDLLQKMQARNTAEDRSTESGFFTAIDYLQWKKLGIESATLGTIVQRNGALAMEIRTFDMVRAQAILGKRFAKLQPRDVVNVVRRYANLLLEEYTQKPGIFSSKIVFIGRRTKAGHKQVFMADFDGENVVQITKSSAPHLSPHWSPDGKYITFTSFERGNPDLYLYNLATGRKRLLSNYKGINSGAQWAPNGLVIAYTGSHQGDSDIFTLDPFTGVRKKLIRGSGLDVDPIFSPDGRHLAFVSGRFGNPHIFLADLDWSSKTKVRVVRDQRLTFAGWYNSTPDWSPDSQRIVFAGYDKDIDRYDIFMMGNDGTRMERLTLKTGDNESPSFAPNGQMIVFQSNRRGSANIKDRSQLWLMNRDGSGQRVIETGLYEAYTPDWSGPLYNSRFVETPATN